MALHFDYASAAAPTSSKRPAPTATQGSSYTAPLALRFLYSFEELVELGGMPKKIKVGHFRLCYSRKMFVAAYQERVLDAHNRAFIFYGGVPLRRVYDNLKTVVDTVFAGKERKFKRRFLTLANHYCVSRLRVHRLPVGRKVKLRIQSVMCVNGE